MKLRKHFALRHWILVISVALITLLAGSPVIKYCIALAAGTTPSVSSPAQGQALNTSSVLITGIADVNSSVDVYIDNVLSGTTVAAGDGSWSFSTGTLAEAAHNVYATTLGPSGETLTSTTVDFQIDLTPPVISITKPADNHYVNLPEIQGVTEPEAEVTISVYGKDSKVTADLFGNWSYFDPGLPEGTNSVTVTAVDKAGNVGNPSTSTFTLDMTRPVVLPDLFPGDDMTNVPVSISTYVSIREKSPIDPTAFQSAIRLTEFVSDTVYRTVNGTVYNSVYTDVYGEQIYSLIFMPETLLRISARYTVEVNPLLSDPAGNQVMPRNWTFTTVGDVYGENPHGNYIDNVNTCVNCHKPHTATDSKLVRPPDSPSNSLDNYCNACHDGTSAPFVSNWSMPNLHNVQVSIDSVKGSGSCTACHNPHLTWVPENPNLLQDYYLYLHNDPTNPYLPNSSEQELCESCHEGTIKDDPRVNYIRYQYKKSNTSTGVPEDYSLCLRCHDGGKAVNIAVYYSLPSGHFLIPLDDSPINGYMPCADCHETHGSENIKLLKNKLGHNKVQAFKAGSSWDTDTERRFCTGCHNGLTELYGITVKFDATIPGHETGNPDQCSRCHGGSTVAAAHAPVVPK
ncbi:MAG: cytochrome c3 family protein [Eubacteriales bacterium]